MKNQVQLITYVDRLTGGGIPDLNAILRGPLEGLFGGIHLLPFFYPIDGSDAGFDPIDHTQVDPRLGTWDDLRELSQDFDVMVDLIVNHVSARSPQFLDFSQKGRESRHANAFLTFDRVFSQGATESELLEIYRPRAGLPFTQVKLENGELRLLWTTFTPQQIDIDVASPQGIAYLAAILDQFQKAGVRAIRLDAVGYAIKKAGTSCFMIPETFEYIEALTAKAHSLGMEVLVELHSHHLKQIEIARRVDWVYDFALPPLILHTLYVNDVKPLMQWLKIRPLNAITVLDTHDGIGVIDVGGSGDEPGLLDPAAIENLVKTIHSMSDDESLRATGAAASNLDLYQVNCTFFDALGRNETKYLIARAIQFFVPGIPQVYYVGLLEAVNDMELLARTGVGRDINRHYFTKDEVLQSLGKTSVAKLCELIRIRNSHRAFAGQSEIESPSHDTLKIKWTHEHHWISLSVELGAPKATVEYSSCVQNEIGHISIGEC